MPHWPELIGVISQLRQFGVEMVDKAGTKLDMPKEQMTAWLQYRYDALFTDKVSPPFNADPVGLFLEEKLLSAHAWPVFIDRMPKVLLKGKFEPAFRLLPVMKAGEKRRSNLNMHLYGVANTRFSKNPQAAFSYLTWITGKEFAIQGILAGKGAPIARPDFWEDPRLYEQTPGEKLLKDLMANIEADFLQTNWQTSKFDQAFFDTIQKMDIGKAKVDDTYAALTKGLQGVLDLSPA
jgi:ABC-type glycerol-3-phosphate transport system substrate-binding protein